MPEVIYKGAPQNSISQILAIFANICMILPGLDNFRLVFLILFVSYILKHNCAFYSVLQGEKTVGHRVTNFLVSYV